MTKTKQKHSNLTVPIPQRADCPNTWGEGTQRSNRVKNNTKQKFRFLRQWKITGRTPPQEQAQSVTIPITLPRDRKHEGKQFQWPSSGTEKMAKGYEQRPSSGTGNTKGGHCEPSQEHKCEERPPATLIRHSRLEVWDGNHSQGRMAGSGMAWTWLERTLM